MKRSVGENTTKRPIRRVIVIISAFALILVALSISVTYAKYINETSYDGVADTPKFYFESDLLSADGAEYELIAGTNSVEFTIFNYADKFRISEVDIDYTVTVTEASGAHSAVISKASGSLDQNDITPELDQELQIITVSNLEAGKTYTVSVMGNGGFVKTVSATFTVKDKMANVYMNVDDNPDNEYVLLTVWTEDHSGAVNVTFPVGLVPDNTCEGLENVKTADGSFNDDDLSAFGSRTYRFFKTDQYNNGVFTVKVGGITAVEK